jgi:predicted  nucleic acid-binding Zn-ribbon protein
MSRVQFTIILILIGFCGLNDAFGVSIQGNRDTNSKISAPDDGNLEYQQLIKKIKALSKQKKDEQAQRKEEAKKPKAQDLKEQIKIDQEQSKDKIRKDLNNLDQRQEKVKQQLKALEEQRERLKVVVEPVKESVKETDKK